MNIDSFKLDTNQFYALYAQFLSYFPPQIHGIISVALALLIVYAVYQVLKKNFVYLILLVLLLPQAAPILKNVWDNLLEVLNFLMKK